MQGNRSKFLILLSGLIFVASVRFVYQRNQELSQANNGRNPASLDTTAVLPPVLSPDNPVFPRVSSKDNHDSPLNNLTRKFSKFVIDQTATIPQALCNDGSKPVYYFKPGFGAGAKRWVIWLEGGGGCASDDPDNPSWCGNRVGLYSSSNGMLSSVPDLAGILSKSDQNNPDFYSYNLVSVHYCSSDYWSGTGQRKVMDKTTGKQWWFSGKKIVQAFLQDLKLKRNFSNATNVIVVGSSAGGAGIVSNADQFRNSVPNADMTMIVDAIWTPVHPLYYASSTPPSQRPTDVGPNEFRESYAFASSQGNLSCLDYKTNNCQAGHPCPENPYECMVPGVAGRFVGVPFYISADQLDKVVLDRYNFEICEATDQTQYQPWLDGYAQAVSDATSIATGYFAPRLGKHGLTPTSMWSSQTITLNGIKYRLRDSFGAWYFNRTAVPRVVIQPPSPSVPPHLEASFGCGNQ